MRSSESAPLLPARRSGSFYGSAEGEGVDAASGRTHSPHSPLSRDLSPATGWTGTGAINDRDSLGWLKHCDRDCLPHVRGRSPLYHAAANATAGITVALINVPLSISLAVAAGKSNFACLCYLSLVISQSPARLKRSVNTTL
jgi:hypothetical protein